MFGVLVAGYRPWRIVDATLHDPAVWTGSAYGSEASLVAMLGSVLLVTGLFRCSASLGWMLSSTHDADLPRSEPR